MLSATRTTIGLVLALTVAACGSDEPFCGQPLDITGRLTVYCPDMNQDPVCDHPGDTARYEDTASGFRLVGGETAGCGSDDQVACPVGTVGEARCITDPEL